MRRKSRELVAIMIVSLLGIAPIRARAQATGDAGSPIASFARSGADAAESAQSPTENAKGRITLTLRQVTVKEALRAIARQADVRLMYNDNDLPADQKVTVTISDATVDEALAVVLRGTGLLARRTESGIVVEQGAPREASEREMLDGSLSGVVTDAATGRPIAGVSLRLEGTSLAASSGSDGVYRFAAVPAGAYTLAARQVGYEKITTSVDIAEGTEQKKDLAMSRTPTVLDQVVTTGAVVPTEVKALPSPISIITADQIERTHALSFTTVLRQAVPTAVAFDQPGNPIATQISVRGASSLQGIGNVKVFIDGIEATDYAFTPVDPTSIDRIEIVRGPQAATIYGADAAGGVVQIFTKRGVRSNRPRVDAQVAFGAQQTPYPGFASIPRQRYSLSAKGGDSSLAYNFGGGYSRLADYLPNGELSRQATTSVYGAMRYTSRWLDADLSARHYDNDAPTVVNPALLTAGYLPESKPYYTDLASVNQTVGAQIDVTPTQWWHHQVTVGVDRYSYRAAQKRPRLTSPADTLRSLTQRASHKLSVAYNTSVRGTLLRGITGSLAVGVDHYWLETDVLNTSRALNTDGSIKTLPAGSLNASVRFQRNTGYFAQGLVGLRDMLFVTAGVRAEDNSLFGTDYGIAVLPRVGVTFVRDVGGATVKVRASYGRALRTPSAGQASGSIGSSSITLPNPLLAAEQQRGWDGGVDLVFRDKMSMSVTGFSQRARDLIALMQVASSPLPTYQFQNVGEVSNRGIELEAKASPTKWLTLAAQYGYVRSRFTSVGAPNGSLRVGDAPLGIPARTAGAVITAIPWRTTSITTGLTYVGSLEQSDFVAEYRCFGTFAEPECPSTFLTEGSTRDFTMRYPAFTKVDVSIVQTLTNTLSAFLAVNNATDVRVYEGRNTSPILGRNTMLGVNIRL